MHIYLVPLILSFVIGSSVANWNDPPPAISNSTCIVNGSNDSCVVSVQVSKPTWLVIFSPSYDCEGKYFNASRFIIPSLKTLPLTEYDFNDPAEPHDLNVTFSCYSSSISEINVLQWNAFPITLNNFTGPDNSKIWNYPSSRLQVLTNRYPFQAYYANITRDNITQFPATIVYRTLNIPNLNVPNGAAPIMIGKNVFPSYTNEYNHLQSIDQNSDKKFGAATFVTLRSEEDLGLFLFTAGNPFTNVVLESYTLPFTYVIYPKLIHINSTSQIALHYQEPYTFKLSTQELKELATSYPFYIRVSLETIGDSYEIYLGRDNVPDKNNHLPSTRYYHADTQPCYSSTIISENFIFNTRDELEHDLYITIIRTKYGGLLDSEIDVSLLGQAYVHISDILYPKLISVDEFYQYSVSVDITNHFKVVVSPNSTSLSALSVSIITPTQVISTYYGVDTVFDVFSFTTPSALPTSLDEKYNTSKPWNGDIYITVGGHRKPFFSSLYCAATSSSNVPIAIYPALNYGYCNDGYITFRHNKYQCQCASYTAGPHCAYECPYQYINDTYVTCSGFGSCYYVPSQQVAKCACNDNYFGDNCSVFCSPETNCSSHGACISNQNSAYCGCFTGWIGENCDVACPIDSKGIVCSGNGNCVQDGLNTTTSKCLCYQGFNGYACETVQPVLHDPNDYPYLIIISIIAAILLLSSSVLLIIVVKMKKKLSTQYIPLNLDE